MKRALGAIAFLIGFIALLNASDRIEHEHMSAGEDVTVVRDGTECKVWSAPYGSDQVARVNCSPAARNEWQAHR